MESNDKQTRLVLVVPFIGPPFIADEHTGHAVPARQLAAWETAWNCGYTTLDEIPSVSVWDCPKGP
jgi:hypothetical protein